LPSTESPSLPSSNCTKKPHDASQETEVALFSWTVCRLADYGSVRAACSSAS
jgi:hypothetical protein